MCERGKEERERNRPRRGREGERERGRERERRVALLLAAMEFDLDSLAAVTGVMDLDYGVVGTAGNAGAGQAGLQQFRWAPPPLSLAKQDGGKSE